MPNQTTNAASIDPAMADAKDDAEAAFEAFLSDIDGLTISDTDVQETRTVQTHSANRVSTNDHTVLGSLSLTNQSRPKNGNDALKKKELIDRAEEGQQTWIKFSNNKHSSAFTGPSEEPNRAPVSFELKKKKKKKVKRPISKGSLKLEPLPQAPQPECPHWITVVDTCCFLDEYDIMSDLISAARHTSLLGDSAAVVEEPITIVLPYKVLGELDYRSKMEEEVTSYRARRAIRTLEAELQSQQPGHMSTAPKHSESLSRNERGGTKASVIRAQSLEDMDAAALVYLERFGSDVNNDDHILACALAEQETFQSAARARGDPLSGTGGVVLLTDDRNLSCKAHANRLKVQSPTAFLEYHRRRSESLWTRVCP